MTDQTVAVTARGLGQLRRDLRAMGDDLAQLKAANAAAAALVAAEASRRAPRRTGRLAGTARGSKGASRATVSAGRATVPYAGPIHYGWPARHIEAQPFVTDAAVETQSRWVPLYEQEIAQVVEKLSGRTY